MYVCMYVCMCVCVCMYVCMYVCVGVCIYISMYMCTYDDVGNVLAKYLTDVCNKLMVDDIHIYRGMSLLHVYLDDKWVT